MSIKQAWLKYEPKLMFFSLFLNREDWIIFNKSTLKNHSNNSKKPKNEDIEQLSKSVEQICVTLWSSFLRLSTKSGQTLCQCIATSCQSIIRSTCELMVSLSKCSKRHESLQKVGEVWQKYDEIKEKIPRENAQAVQLKIQVRNLTFVYLIKMEYVPSDITLFGL